MPPAPALETRIPKRPAANTLVLLALWIVVYASFTLFTPPLLLSLIHIYGEARKEMASLVLGGKLVPMARLRFGSK